MAGQGISRARSETTAIIRSVSSVAFEIGGAEPFERAVRMASAWMRARNRAVPDDAETGAPFDVGGGGAPVARAVALDIDQGRIWSAAIDDPDASHVGRTWITEITIVEQQGAVHFGTRLLNFTRGEDQPFSPSIPRLARDLIAELPCLADGEMLRDETKVIATPDDLDAMCELLERPGRRLPVILLAEGVSRPPFSSLETLTRRLAGAAHVLGISDECTWLLRRRVGRDLSVFDGAVRMYRPGLRLDEADPYDHPLWLPRPDLPPGDGGPVVTRVLATGIAKGTTDYPRFDAVRQAAAQRTIDNQPAGTSDTEMARRYELQNETLRSQLQDLRDEQNQWLADAERERASAEHQIAELRAEVRSHRAQNEMLRVAVASGGGPSEREPLADFAEFGTWAAKNLSPRIWFSPKAIKAAERTGQYRDPVAVGEALFALDDIYVPMRWHPDDELHRRWQERLTELGLSLTPCFTRDGDLQRFPEYSVQYRGERRWCDLHLKHGNGADPKSAFRVYFHWDEREGVLLVGHLPSHLANNMTN